MKKRSYSLLFIVLFFGLCLVPSIGMLLFGASPLLANEAAPRTPALQNADGSLNPEILADLTDYIGTRFALRPVLVTMRSFIYEKLLRSSAEEQVVLGRGGELYYRSTVDDYCGQGLSDDRLRQIAANLKEIQTLTESRGGCFLFTVAPNKNSLLPAKMPSGYRYAHETSNYARLLPLLEEYGVNYVDLLEVLGSHPEWYYRTDSHWTAEGAAHAADALLQALGRERSFSAGPFTENGLHIGDLYQMLYPLGKGREAKVTYGPGFRHVTAADPREGNAITIRTRSPEGEGSLYCRRDSFGIALYPYLADAFDEAEFSRSSDYRPESFAALESDVVILEIVERNLPALLTDSYSGL